MISVVICTRNRAEMFVDCVNSLLKQNCDVEYEILIVDNNSIDNTEEISREFIKKEDNIRYFKEKIIGYGAPRNRGWLESKGEFVAYIDDDEIASSHWLQSIHEAFSDNSTPDIVGGRYLLRYDFDPPAWFCEKMERVEFGLQKGILNTKKYPYGFAGGNIAFKKDVLQKLGGFSDLFNMKDGSLMMGEDSEICKRAIDKGMELYYDPNIAIFHRMNQKNYDINKRIERARKKGESIRKVFGKKRFISHYFKYITLFVIKITDFSLDLLYKNPTTISVKLKEKIAFRKGYFLVRNNK